MKLDMNSKSLEIPSRLFWLDELVLELELRKMRRKRKKRTSPCLGVVREVFEVDGRFGFRLVEEKAEKMKNRIR